MKKHIKFYFITLIIIIILLFPLLMFNKIINKTNTNEVIKENIDPKPNVVEDKEEVKEDDKIKDTDKDKNKDEDKDEVINKDLFADYYDEADDILKDLTIEEKLAQMFIVPFTEVDNIDDYDTIGGFILYSSDIKNISKEQLINKIKSRQDEAKIKYIMTIDEEGGTVSRLSYNKNLINEKIKSPRSLYAIGGIDKVLEVEEMKDKLLLELGFNLNLAPVADIATNPSDFMYARSIGLSPNDTGNYISLVTKKAKELNFSTCLKHFPGYGPNGDSHKIQTIDNRDLDYLKENDLIPFKMGVEAGTPFVLISHNIITSVDDKYPASLSKDVINILKNDLNYTGIIMSDELTMDALDSYNTDNNLAILAIEAGNDIVITKEYNDFYNRTLQAIKDGQITEERINESVRKILAWKIAYNIY